MAHIEKYKAHALGQMFAHYLREGEHVNRPGIVPEWSGANYKIMPSGDAGRDIVEAPMERVRQVLAEVDARRQNEGQRKTRKDAVLMADVVVSLPDNVPPEDEQKFFIGCWKCIQDAVGNENMLGGYVHKDEVYKDGEHAGEPCKPHIHIAFMPIKDGSFNFKGLFTREDYRGLHDALEESAEEYLGYRPHVKLTTDERAKRIYTKTTKQSEQIKDVVAASTAEAQARWRSLVEDAEEEKRKADKALQEAQRMAEMAEQDRQEAAGLLQRVKAAEEALRDLSAQQTQWMLDWKAKAGNTPLYQEARTEYQRNQKNIQTVRREVETVKKQASVDDGITLA